MKKVSFTLIEVLIAIALTALCAPLLFSVPFQIAKKEFDAIFLCEIERLADKESYDLKIDLLSHGPLWKEMRKSEASPRLLEQKELEISFVPGKKRTYSMKKEIFKLTSKNEAKLFQVKISLKSPSEKTEHSFVYLYTIPV